SWPVPTFSCSTRPSSNHRCVAWSAPTTSRWRCRLASRAGSRDGAARADQARRPVAVPQVADGHAVGLIDGMHEAALAEIDADVAQAVTVGVREHQHVAWFEVVRAHLWATG